MTLCRARAELLHLGTRILRPVLLIERPVKKAPDLGNDMAGPDIFRTSPASTSNVRASCRAILHRSVVLFC